ncbi:MAG: DUF488 family protein [Gemmatimonadota bacterium]
MSTLFTVGHSTRSLSELVALLREAGVDLVVDVRRYPASRRFPHFSRESLEEALPRAGIEYRHEPAMGGRRRLQGDSPNGWWRSEGFRAYADHLASEEFQDALRRLEAEAAERAPAVMCAEIVPWRCHRQLVADALVARGHEVVHLLEAGKSEPHVLNEAARVEDGGRLVYPAPEKDQLELLE